MGRVVVKTIVDAHVEHCFELARDVEVHCLTSSFTGERVLPPGRTSGRLELGETVTFHGRHFGFRFRLTASIIEMQPPHRFIDHASGGAFRSMHHVHEFVAHGDATEMIDTLEWRLIAGVLGRAADVLLVEPHMTRYLTKKQQLFKTLAESAKRSR